MDARRINQKRSAHYPWLKCHEWLYEWFPGRDDAMAICVPINALINVDLPHVRTPRPRQRNRTDMERAWRNRMSEVVSVVAASVMLVFGILIVVGCLFRHHPHVLRYVFQFRPRPRRGPAPPQWSTLFLRRPAESTAVMRKPRVTAEDPTIGTRPNSLVSKP